MAGAAQEIAQLVPPEAAQILMVLFLGFLVGLEREAHRAEEPGSIFGGVRTFPLIGLLGYALSLLSGPALLPVALGLGVVGVLMAVSFHHKLTAAAGSGRSAGVTSEVSALIVYLVGALAQHGFYWISATLVVACLLLLELKEALERLSARIPRNEVLTFTKFLVLSVVILPIVPNQPFGGFALNPFKTWLVVVAVASISYGSYVLQKLLPAGGVLLAALLGGAYSSTVATVSLAKKAASAGTPHLFAGGILLASGVMYLRFALLLALFNAELLRALGVPFLGLAIVGIGGGWLWSRRSDPTPRELEKSEAKNPLELSAALFFALVFLAMLVVTHLALTYLGKGGVFSLAALVGVTDPTPFILGLTQGVGARTPLALAAGAIAIAAASNNVVKGIYARSFAD